MLAHLPGVPPLPPGGSAGSSLSVVAPSSQATCPVMSPFSCGEVGLSWGTKATSSKVNISWAQSTFPSPSSPLQLKTNCYKDRLIDR